MRSVEEKGIMVFDCFINALLDALSMVLKAPRDELEKAYREGKLKVTKTPDPSMGDYGVSIHYFLIKLGVPRGEWSNVGSMIAKFIEEKYSSICRVKNVNFINGYVNFTVDYLASLKRIVEEILNDTYRPNVGLGRLVVVEHTSANPVHPLHIGSGRNSVLGDTYARLLRYIGFNVNTRFYVNDMGRQVAILVYGYSVLRKYGVKPKDSMKIDHWFGVVYALTNIIMEKTKLIKELDSLVTELKGFLNEKYVLIKGLTESSREFLLLDILTELMEVINRFNFVHNPESIGEILVYLKGRVEGIKDNAVKEKLKQFVSELEGRISRFLEALNHYYELVKSESKVCLLDPDVCLTLSREIRDYDEVEEGIRELMVKLEEGDSEVTGVFRQVVDQVLQGFKETLFKLNIQFDSFDYETDIHRVYTKQVLSLIEKSGYVDRSRGALIVDLDNVALRNDYVKKLFEPDYPGKVTLMRSDGTTLYVTRDIGYSIFKLKELNPFRVYNVIAIEQDREQKQVKAILHVIGFHEYVDKLIHFPYEMVNLKGRSMSGRRGEYYTIDELIDCYKRFVTQHYVENQIKLAKEYFDQSLEDYLGNLEKIAVACSRALLLSVDPRKVLVFDPSKPEEYDVGAWIVYTFVRLQGILRKAFGVEPLDSINNLKKNLRSLYESFSSNVELSDLEKNVVENLMGFKQTLLKAYEEMNPSEILVYTHQLCQNLNKFYETHPVINEQNPVKRAVRLSIVVSSFIVLRDLMDIMGFPIVRKL